MSYCLPPSLIHVKQKRRNLDFRVKAEHSQLHDNPNSLSPSLLDSSSITEVNILSGPYLSARLENQATIYLLSVFCLIISRLLYIFFLPSSSLHSSFVMMSSRVAAELPIQDESLWKANAMTMKKLPRIVLELSVLEQFSAPEFIIFQFH